MAHLLVAEKLKRVLYKFSDVNYKVSDSDDLYLQKLIGLLNGSENTKSGEGPALARLPFCLEWLGHVAGAWEGAPPHPSVAAFALRLAGVVAADPGKFAPLRSAGTLDRLLGSLQAEADRSGSVGLARVSLLGELLRHDDGCRWVMDSGAWERVVRSSLETKCLQVSREGHRFVGRLVARLQATPDCDGCERVLGHILEPLSLQGGDGDGVQASVLLASSVLEGAVSGPGADATLLALERRGLEPLMWRLAARLSADEASLRGVLRTLLLPCFFAPRDARRLKAKVFEVLSWLTARGLVASVLYACYQCKVYFRRFGVDDATFEDRSKLYQLEDQLLCFQILPMICLMKKHQSQDVFEWNYAQKIFDFSSEETVRLAYPFRDALVADKEKILEHVSLTINYIMQLKNYVDKEWAATVCQALAYALKSVVLRPPEEPVERYSSLLSAILDALSVLIDHFRISWRESVESICVFAFGEMLLKDASLPSNVAVRNHLPPNLALLVDTVSGSSLQELGPLMQRRLHDPSWDVRDSTLELLRTVTEVSRAGFPSFQELVLESGLCELALAAAAGDGESYVRASALKCLGTMVRVPRLWDACLASRELPDKMVSILTKESEGLVRREAALLLKEIYQHQGLPGASQGRVFAAMAAAATSDLYWEVKLGALCFWEKVIEQRLGDQGMIDGRFPAVTFSREDRKIVTLTEGEVRARIGRALEELGRHGCLQVLLSAIHDCDLQVVFKASAVVTSLSALLSQYDLLPAGGAPGPADGDEEAARPLNGDAWELSAEDGVVPDPDEVIENIVSESDMGLLARVFADRTSVSAAPRRVAVAPMAARDFLSALGAVDLRQLVSERARWLDDCGEGLGCLLDDILLAHGDPGDLVTDCY
ncbi:uncharacterized protein LOC134541106 isoform X2 [Bacillus rossius redtenbacheri]|uniref:uncharacterized protein LOC134541106 isoform X2 n=1 Tax=Bacillus rossius redtenbacheri TaxID=93214 RepID=UPI002FDDB225